MFTQSQTYAAEIEQLSTTLTPLIDYPKVSDLLDELLDDIDLEAIDACCYNGLYGDDGDFDGHGYVAMLQCVGQFQVLRIAIVTYFRDFNPGIEDFYLCDADGNPLKDENGCDMENPDFEDYWPESKRAEVVQFWFCPDGSMYQRSVPRTAELRLIDVQDCWDVKASLCPATSDCSFVMSEWHPQYYSHTGEIIEHSTVDNEQVAKMAYEFAFGNAHPRDDFFTTKIEERLSSFHAWHIPAAFSTRQAALYFYEYIRLAHRNHIDLSRYDREDWFSYLCEMEDSKANLRDIRIICPPIDTPQWCEWRERRKKRIAREASEAERRRIELMELARLNNIERTKSENEYYQKHRSLLLNIVIGNDDIELRVLKTVAEFYDTGIEQGHCVYNHSYYMFPDWLVFNAYNRRTNHLLSTVTYDLVRNEIIANLTKGNQVPERFDEIEALLLSHTQFIQRDYQKMMQDCPELSEVEQQWRIKQESERSWNKGQKENEQKQKDAILARRKQTTALDKSSAQPQPQITLAI